MKAPAFWWRQKSAASALLAPAAALYRAVADQRMERTGARAAIPVVCIGNLTVGGAGKTPAAITTARLLAFAGERPVFISRGYGARMAGPVPVDRTFHRAVDVGDEPLLLSRRYPTIVSRDRLAGAESAARAGASVVVLDDGFQNTKIAKDCAVLVVDAARGIGNRLVLPAGPLRAGLSRQLDHAHAVLVVGEGDGAQPVVDGARERGLPVFTAHLQSHRAGAERLRGKPVLAFTGIAAPEKFFASLAAEGIDVQAKRAFADHHRFTPAEAAALLKEAADKSLTLVTTEKDFMRLAGGRGPLARLRETSHVLRVRLVLDDAAAYRAFILDRMHAASASRPEM